MSEKGGGGLEMGSTTLAGGLIAKPGSGLVSSESPGKGIEAEIRRIFKIGQASTTDMQQLKIAPEKLVIRFAKALKQ